MPVTDQDPINSYVANGVTTTFPYTFLVLDDGDISVTVDGVEASLSVDYTVSGVGNGAGGNVVFGSPPVAGAVVVVQRDMAFTRERDYQENGDLSAAALDDDADRGVLLSQQNRRDIRYSVRLNPFSDHGDAVIPNSQSASDRAGRIVGFDADGNIKLLVADIGTSLVDLSGDSGASLIGYSRGISGAAVRSVESKLDDAISVMDIVNATGDGVTDDRAALVTALNYMATLSGTGFKVLDLAGRVYAISDQIDWSTGSHVIMRNGGLKAIAGTWSAGDFLLNMSGGYQNGLSDITLDANSLAGCLKLSGANRTMLRNVDGYHFTTYGLHHTAGSIPSMHRVHMHQWLSGDAEYNDQAYRTAVGMRLDYVDARMVDCTSAWCARPLEIGSAAHHNRAIGCHFYNGSGGGGAHTDPVNIKVEAGSYKNALIGTYCDNGYIDLHSTNILIEATEYLYNSANATMTSHVRVYAQSANDTLDDLVYSDNQHSGSFKVFDLIDNGYSWDASIKLEDYTDAINITPNGINEYRGTTSAGYVRRFISSNSLALAQFIASGTTGTVDCGADGNDFVIRTNGTTRVRIKDGGGIAYSNRDTTGDATGANKTLTVDDSGVTFNVQNGANNVTYTLPANAPAGWWARVQRKGTGTLTLTAASGASLRGSAGGSNTVPQWGSCLILCGRNSGGSAAEFYLEGGFS